MFLIHIFSYSRNLLMLPIYSTHMHKHSESIRTKCEVQYCVVKKNSKWKKIKLAFNIFYLECVNHYTDNWKLDTVKCNYVCYIICVISWPAFIKMLLITK